MRTLMILLAAGSLVGGCACSEASTFGLPVENNATPAAVVTTLVPPATPHLVPGGWWLSPDAPADQKCLSVLAPGVTIPCRDVLLVCTTGGDGPATNVLMPAIYSCTDESPTDVDVCTTRPADEWLWYDLTAAECASLTGG